MSRLEPTVERRFSVHVAGDGGGSAHAVAGASFEAAAVAFVELWRPPLDAEGEVSVIVVDADSGRRHCFTIDAVSGDAEPCA